MTSIILVALAAITSPLKIDTLLDLSHASVVVRGGRVAPSQQVAPQVLAEEVAKRTGLRWSIGTTHPKDGAAIAIVMGNGDTLDGLKVPRRAGVGLPEDRTDGFRLLTTTSPPTVWIIGHDPRGTLYGVGELLRRLNWSRGKASVPAGLHISSAPAEPIRGHQLGYRPQANSYDGWDEKQFDQYVRELALFGANAIEGIPFQDDRKTSLMPVSRDRMNRKLSDICAKYGLEYWIWTPADFDLKDNGRREELLKKHEALFRDCRRMDGVFFPGGDPGDNPPKLVIPYLADLSKLLVKYHPSGRIWLSMQGYGRKETDEVLLWIEKQRPQWLGGIVAGPSSPPIPAIRTRLPKEYGLRDYPDITHTVRCQYEVSFWDPAFALTLGREPPNPRPTFYKMIHGCFSHFTDGSISYSDGINDDVNKAVWLRLGWQPDASVREILVQYARFFFGSDVADEAADGILALEKNWEGPLATNGAVDGTLALWQQLERRKPELAGNWRWQLCLLRAYYDAYTRHRLLYESRLEREANRILEKASSIGATEAMTQALARLRRAADEPVKKDWRARIEALCGELFQSIRLQTSVPRYQASGFERGCVLDFVDYPLNNRWWLEDEFARIGKIPSEAEKVRSLVEIARWENPGPGSYYDEVGHVGKSPHVVHGEGLNTDPLMERNPNPGYWWWDEGRSRKRLSWQTSMGWPLGLVYDGLDSRAAYRIRMTGYGDVKLRMNGELVKPSMYGKGIGEFKEFPVPPDLLKDGKITLTFDVLDEGHLNWRQQSRVSEVWLLKETKPDRSR